jgi:hypothetical protein
MMLATDFKSVSTGPTSSYYALPSSIYRRFSRQSKLRPAWYEHISPLIFLGHRAQSQAIRVCRFYAENLKCEGVSFGS